MNSRSLKQPSWCTRERNKTFQLWALPHFCQTFMLVGRAGPEMRGILCCKVFFFVLFFVINQGFHWGKGGVLLLRAGTHSPHFTGRVSFLTVPSDPFIPPWPRWTHPYTSSLAHNFVVVVLRQVSVEIVILVTAWIKVHFLSNRYFNLAFVSVCTCVCVRACMCVCVCKDREGFG